MSGALPPEAKRIQECGWDRMLSGLHLPNVRRLGETLSIPFRAQHSQTIEKLSRECRWDYMALGGSNPPRSIRLNPGRTSRPRCRGRF